MTSAHYTALKIRRNEGHVWNCFWKSFKENFIQSTVIWLIFVAYYFITLITYNIATNPNGQMVVVLSKIVLGVHILVTILCAWVIPLQSKFINPIHMTFKNAFYMGFRHFFRTLTMTMLEYLPMGALVVVVLITGMRGLGIWLLFGISVPTYWCAIIYDKVFEKLETMYECENIDASVFLE